MTTPAGQIAMSDVNVELNYAWNRANSSLNDSAVRVLAQVSSGQISMAHLRSKTNVFNLTIGSAQNGNLASIAYANGYQNQPKVYLILVGTMYSYATGSPACVMGSWPAGTQLTIELRGTIQAYGGLGAGQSGYGGAGGYAMQFYGISGGSVTFYINGGWVYGGGGGGGGGGQGSWSRSSGDTDSCTVSYGGAGGNGQGFGISQSAGAAGSGSGGGTGGYGGGWGGAGYAGASGSRTGTGAACGSVTGGGGGGAAGYAYLGWGNVSSYIGSTGNYSGSVG